MIITKWKSFLPLSAKLFLSNTGSAEVPVDITVVAIWHLQLVSREANPSGQCEMWNGKTRRWDWKLGLSPTLHCARLEWQLMASMSCQEVGMGSNLIASAFLVSPKPLWQDKELSLYQASLSLHGQGWYTFMSELLWLICQSAIKMIFHIQYVSSITCVLLLSVLYCFVRKDHSHVHKCLMANHYKVIHHYHSKLTL